MAGAASWKGAIQFGLIQFTVSVKSAITPTTFSFNYHHGGPDGCHGRLAQGEMICLGCGAAVTSDEREKGYKGKAPVDIEYLESLEAEKAALLNIDKLVPAAQIDPRYFQKSYDVTPDKGAEKIYVLFARILDKLNRVALGKMIMGGKEYLCVFRPKGSILAMELLYWADELKGSSSAEAAIAGVTVSANEIKLGEKLAAAMTGDFDPLAYTNDYAANVGAYLEDFLAGEVAPAVLPKPKVVTSRSLEDALAASLAAIGGEAEKKVAKAKGKRKAA